MVLGNLVVGYGLLIVCLCVCVWLWWFIVKHIIVSMFELNAYNLYVCLLNFKYISNLIYKNIICTCGIYM